MTDLSSKPLNGETTHPLTVYARQALQELVQGPRPRQRYNPGVVNRLTREPGPLATIVSLPSPFSSHKGKGLKIPHLQITAAGVAELGRKADAR